jgi:ankyrin repeat protein
MIDADASFDLRSAQGNTALHMACVEGKPETVKLLIQEMKKRLTDQIRQEHARTLPSAFSAKVCSSASSSSSSSCSSRSFASSSSSSSSSLSSSCRALTSAHSSSSSLRLAPFDKDAQEEALRNQVEQELHAWLDIQNNLGETALAKCTQSVKGRIQNDNKARAAILLLRAGANAALADNSGDTAFGGAQEPATRVRAVEATLSALHLPEVIIDLVHDYARGDRTGISRDPKLERELNSQVKKPRAKKKRKKVSNSDD